MVLNVHGLRVPLVDTPFGPLASFQDRHLEALDLTVQWAVEGRIPGFRRAIEERRPTGQFPVFAYPADAEDDLTESGKMWRRLTGEDLGDDVYVLHSALGTPNVAVPRQVLMRLIDEVNELRDATVKPAGPWLYRQIPIWHAPAPGEEEAIRILERQSEQLEAISRGPRADEARAREAAKRRFLLLELDSLGILSDAGFPDKERWLAAWTLPLTLSYLRAAHRLHLYLVSPGRRRYFPDPDHQPVLGARISLDWFRHPGPSPPGVDADLWLGFCEQTLAESQVSGYEGTLFVREGGPWYEICWRRDDGQNPSVTAAHERPVERPSRGG
jgi:hypothetical protein